MRETPALLIWLWGKSNDSSNTGPCEKSLRQSFSLKTLWRIFLKHGGFLSNRPSISWAPTFRWNSRGHCIGRESRAKIKSEDDRLKEKSKSPQIYFIFYSQANSWAICVPNSTRPGFISVSLFNLAIQNQKILFGKDKSATKPPRWLILNGHEVAGFTMRKIIGSKAEHVLDLHGLFKSITDLPICLKYRVL